MLRNDDVAMLAQLTLQLYEAAARLYAEISPALLDSTAVGDRGEVKDLLKLQEFILNYIITPTVIDLHRGFIRRCVELGTGHECEGEAEKLIPLIQQVAEFANRLCKLSERYAPGNNAYAALIGDEFTTGHQRIAQAADR